jgi:hypothetical protein
MVCLAPAFAGDSGSFGQLPFFCPLQTVKRIFQILSALVQACMKSVDERGAEHFHGCVVDLSVHNFLASEIRCWGHVPDFTCAGSGEIGLRDQFLFFPITDRVVEEA